VRRWIGTHAEAGQEPLLVVPRAEDAERFERELSRTAALGVTVLTFGRLFSLVAASLDAPAPPELTGPQRLAALRRAIAATQVRGGLASSSRRRGFAPALDRLIDEMQAANLDAAGVAAQELGTERLEDLAALFSAYTAERERLGRGDTHVTAAAATSALARDPGGWSQRPVAFYGFDDLTGEQFALVERLSAAAPVLATVTYEDRDALTERARLRNELLEIGGEVESELDRNPEYTASPTLRHLDRFLFDEEPEPLEAPDDGLLKLEAAGRRVQAEQIAIEVARLLRVEDQSPDEIAIALRSPESDGPLLAAVLTAHGIPAGLQARLPLSSTAVGTALTGLLRACSGTGTARDVLAFLRGPGILGPGAGDSFELALLRSGAARADDAIEVLREKRPDSRELEAIEALAGNPSPEEGAALLTRFARQIAEPRERIDGARDDGAAIELSAAAAVTTALEELIELALIGDFAADALLCLESLNVPATRGSLAGRVVITGVYEVRARPVANLFVCSLQEGEYPTRDPGDPLLSEAERPLIGLPGRARHESEERYVLYTALSRPSRRLYLCWRSAEEDGGAAAPSPFLEDIDRALGPAAADVAIRRRDLDRVAPSVGEATTPRDLGRALAAARGEASPETDVPGVETGLLTAVHARLAEARARLPKPGELAHPAVLERLAERERYGTSTLELWLTCSYKWFVDHELGPKPLGPPAEPMVQGGLVHAVFELTYKAKPGGTPMPTPATLGAWIDHSDQLVEDLAKDVGLDGPRPEMAASRARAAALIRGFFEREAAQAGSRQLTPAMFEASFGRGEQPDREPLDLGTFKLHGLIDRIDLDAAEANGAVFDYKTGKDIAIGNNLISKEAIAQKGKLQPGLYAIALRDLWEKRPIAALYHPLGATQDQTPRGIVRKDERDELLSGFGIAPRSKDNLADEDFDAALDAAAETAREIVEGMRGGEIARRPIGGDCGYCDYASVCRIERAAQIEPEETKEEDE
jgi:ATP-dependent helicase/DNAse subunit B